MFKRNKKRRVRSALPALIILILSLSIAYLFYSGFFEDFGLFNKPNDEIPIEDGEYIEVHIIDVGQGDSILILSEYGNILIDAGPGSSEEQLANYLNEISVSEIEYAVFTHPHEDHIGGADMIMTDYTVSNVILPDCDYNTKTYQRMMEAIDESGANKISALPGDEYTLSGITATILSPNSAKYSNINNYSVVVKLTFGQTSFLFTGDAEVDAEAEILEAFSADILDCDVLKLGHHGSHTATSLDFLRAVSPAFAAISCGTGNSYGHPHAAVLSRLADEGVVIYRTDEWEHNSIVFISDGKQVSVKDN